LDDVTHIDWRRSSRIVAMQALVQFDVQGDDFQHELDQFIAESDTPAKSQTLAGQLVRDIWSNCTAYDELIGQTVRHWQLSRIAAVDRAILRLAVHELLDRPQVPPKVAIDEAIELAKVFSTKESPQFINGVLDGVLKRLKQETSDKAETIANQAADEPSDCDQDPRR